MLFPFWNGGSKRSMTRSLGPWSLTVLRRHDGELEQGPTVMPRFGPPQSPICVTRVAGIAVARCANSSPTTSLGPRETNSSLRRPRPDENSNSHRRRMSYPVRGATRIHTEVSRLRPLPARWDRVRDLSVGNQLLRCRGADRYFDNCKSSAESQNDTLRDQIVRIGFAQEVDMEARGDGRHVGSPVGENCRPRGPVSDGHQSWTRDCSTGANMSMGDW